MNVTDTPHVVAICGSQRAESHTRRALRRSLAAAEAAGASTDLVDLSTLDLPTFDADRPEVGDAPELTRRVDRADAVLLGTPMYHGSYASPLKTALDYCGFDEFEETTVGLVAVAGGEFPLPALEHLRSVARALDAWVLPGQVAIPNVHEAFDEAGPTDEAIADRLDELGADLVDYAGVESYPESTVACAVPGAD
jgi:NAD(P)H-dependent FMN reductase